MAEYIDRAVAVSQANFIHGRWDDVYVSASTLMAIPAADVAPVVHARGENGKCSNCDVDIPTDDAHDVIFGSECRFCYYCGARMDGGIKR